MQAPSSTPQRNLRRTVFALAGLTTVAGLCAWQSTTVYHHVNVQYEKHRVLRQLQDLPALKMHFHVKRDSMKVHGQTDFDVYANPVVGTTGTDDKIMTYDGIAEFDEAGAQYNYILVNGVSYNVVKSGSTEQVSCASASSLPPIQDVLQAINNAQPAEVSPDSPQQIQCEDGKLMKMQFAGDQFLLCSGSTSGFQIFGTDLDINISFLEGVVEIPVPEMSDDARESCLSVPSFATVPTSTFDLLSGAGKSYKDRFLQQSTQAVIVPAATCGCKGARRPCIFFHGLNQKNDGPLQNTSTYFGVLGASAPCCTTIKYALIDTVNQGWNEDGIQKKVCDQTLSMSNSSSLTTKTIEDTIIVAHSMGNLMLAGALATGKCSLSSTSTWVNLAGPMRGSMGSDYLQKGCAGGGGLASLLAPIVGQCPANNATKSLAYEGEAYVNATLKAQYDAAQLMYQKYVGAAMCSDSYVGLSGGDQLTYRLGGSLINHKSSKNDGVVEYTSCVADVPVANFKPTYESAFYTTKLNHIDMTFRNGDSVSNVQQKPVKWFECLL